MSFARYAEYKDSGVEWLGEVPAHWGVKRLRFVADLNPSKSELSSRDRAEEVSFVPMEAIGDDGSLNLDRTRPIGEVETGYTFFRDGDVTVAKITPCFENGKGAVMRGLVSGFGFGTTELVVARPKATETTSEYLHWLFISHPFRQLGEAAMYGAGGQKRVPDEFVRNFVVAFPDVTEQTAIAAFLDHEVAKIDSLIAEQQKLIVLLKEKRQAVISHAVTKGLNPDAPMKDSGIEWLGEVPAHWDCVPMKYLVRLQSGGTPSKDRLDYWEGSIPWASAKDMKLDVLADTEDHITDLAVEERAASIVNPGTVLVVVRGMILARMFPVALTAASMAINQDLKGVICRDELRPDFLAWYFRGTADESLCRLDEAGHGTKALRMDAWTSLEIALPPISEQAEIANFIERETGSLDILTAEANKAVALLKEHRSALISAAVTGKIDLRGLGAHKEAA